MKKLANYLLLETLEKETDQIIIPDPELTFLETHGNWYGETSNRLRKLFNQFRKRAWIFRFQNKSNSITKEQYDIIEALIWADENKQY